MTMKDPETLTTRAGHAGWEDHRHYGYSVFNELAGSTSVTALLALAATGRKLTPENCAVLDDIATVLTAADPRIYPLKLVRLASSYGSSLAGLAAATASMHGAVVGPTIAQETALWLVSVNRELSEGEGKLSAIMEKLFSQRKKLPGFGVPFREVDERAVALEKLVVGKGLNCGHYWILQKRIADIVMQSRGLTCNVGLPVAALSLDMGLCADRLASLYTGLTMNCFLANAVEGAEQSPAILQCLPDTAIEYQGRPPRKFRFKD